MKIIPNSISERIMKEHMEKYGPTLSLNVMHSVRQKLPTMHSGDQLYICPLCAINYFYVKGNGIFGNAEFSIDHLPPESVGGKTKVLACKQCNNEAGLYESELNTLLNYGSIQDKNGSIIPYSYVTDKATGDRYRVFVTHEKGKTELNFDPHKKRHDKKLQAFLARMHNGEMPAIEVFAGMPDTGKISRAVLKSAYLLCFTYWGYQFVFSENGQALRNVFNGKSTYPTRVPTTWSDNSTNNIPQGISLLMRGTERLAFVVSMYLHTEARIVSASTIIPAPGEKGWDKLTEFDAFAHNKELTSLTCITLPETLRPDGYTFAWEQPLPISLAFNKHV